MDHADVPAVDLLVGILGRSRTGRLTQSLRERLGVVDAISMGYAALEGAGIVTLAAQVDPEKADDAVQAVRAELRRVRSEGVTDVERRRAVTATEARREFERETAKGVPIPSEERKPCGAFPRNSRTSIGSAPSRPSR